MIPSAQDCTLLIVSARRSRFLTSRGCRDLGSEAAPDDAEKIAIAAVFHDLGVWTHHTMDYLPLSVELLSGHLEEIGRQTWMAEISEIILNHHKLRPYRAAEGARLVEPFVVRILWTLQAGASVSA